MKTTTTTNNAEVLIETMAETKTEIAHLNQVLSATATIQLVADAVKESKNYTDIKERTLRREHEQESAMLTKTNRVSIIGLIIFGISFILLYLCASTIDYGAESASAIKLGIAGGIGLIIAVISLVWVMITQNNFYKTQYVIKYKLNSDPQVTHTYKTKATNDTKALKRFREIINSRGLESDLDYTSIEIRDEHGYKY